MKTEKGQTMIEYILLLSVIMSLIFMVFRSDLFKSYFGDGGKFAKGFASKISCSYRYALGASNGRNCGQDNPGYQNKMHPSYFTGGETRFFGPKSPYPQR